MAQMRATGLLLMVLLSLLAGCREEKPTDPVAPLENAVTLPVEDVRGLENLIRSAPELFITARDVPDMHVAVTADGRKQLADAIRGHTEPGRIPQTEAGSLHLPYPAYEIQVKVPPQQIYITWENPRSLSAAHQSAPDQPFNKFTPFVQQDEALWKAVTKLAPPPQFAKEDIGYLFQATELSANIEGQSITDIPMRRVGIVRGLRTGVPVERPAPTEPPGAVLRFVVAGSPYEVRVWADQFTYAGRTYERKGVLEQMRRIVSTP